MSCRVLEILAVKDISNNTKHSQVLKEERQYTCVCICVLSFVRLSPVLSIQPFIDKMCVCVCSVITE